MVIFFTKKMMLWCSFDVELHAGWTGQFVGIGSQVFFMFNSLVYEICYLYRGSYMSAHVLLNLLNELGKRDKM